jgi:phage/plasmid-like protein (TIGR03299 family)
MPANIESMFSVREMPWHQEGTILADYPGSWDEARQLAGLDWDPITSSVYALTGPGADGTGRYEPVGGWKAITRSDTGAILSINKDTYTVIDHGEMGEIIEAVLAQPNVQWETAGVLDGGRAVWCLALLDEPVTLPGDDSPTLPYLAITTDTTAPRPARCARPRSGSSVPTPSAPPNWKASGPAPPSPSSTRPPGVTALRRPARRSPAPAPRWPATPNSPTRC